MKAPHKSLRALYYNYQQSLRVHTCFHPFGRSANNITNFAHFWLSNLSPVILEKRLMASPCYREATYGKPLLHVPTSSKECTRKLGREVFSPLQEASKCSSQRTTSFVREGKLDSSFEIKKESKANCIQIYFL